MDFPVRLTRPLMTLQRGNRSGRCQEVGIIFSSALADQFRVVPQFEIWEAGGDSLPSFFARSVASFR